jgi:hypothetical protein
MTAEKAEIRRLIMEEIAEDAAKMAVSAQKKCDQLTGGLTLGQAVQKQIESIQKLRQQQAKDEEIDPVHAEHQNKGLQTAHNLITHLLQGTQKDISLMEGRKLGHDAFVAEMSKRAAAEAKKKAAIETKEQELEAGTPPEAPDGRRVPPPRPGSTHPGGSLKSQRRAEEAAEGASKDELKSLMVTSKVKTAKKTPKKKASKKKTTKKKATAKKDNKPNGALRSPPPSEEPVADGPNT